MPATSAVRASGSTEMTSVNPDVSRPPAFVLRACPEQIRGALGEPNRGRRRDGPIALEKALNARGVSGPCVGCRSGHDSTLVRGRSRVKGNRGHCNPRAQATTPAVSEGSDRSLLSVPLMTQYTTASASTAMTGTRNTRMPDPAEQCRRTTRTRPTGREGTWPRSASRSHGARCRSTYRRRTRDPPVAGNSGTVNRGARSPGAWRRTGGW